MPRLKLDQPKGPRAAWPHAEALRELVGGVLVMCVCALALASAAFAEPPLHAHLPEPALEGFDRACGIAVDSAGNVYVASAGESKIRIFDSEHSQIGLIENSDEPCGLAVDSTGRLYVLETKTGDVVRYEPTVYPFSNPSYGAPVTIDESGEATGIAVDLTDDQLYVAKHTRVDTYDSTGRLGIDEVQRIFFDATGGTFKLTFEGETTDSIPYVSGEPEANAEAVEEALEELSTIGIGNVSVAPTPAGHANVAFVGALGNTDLPLMTVDSSNLTNTPPFPASATVFVIDQGFDGHIGEGELTEATGVAAYTSPTGNRYLFVADRAGAGQDGLLAFGGSDIRALELRRTIEGVDHDGDPATPPQPFGFGDQGAYVAADQGDCPEGPTPTQACTAGHIFVYDAASEAVDEFEAGGRFLLRIPSPAPPFAFADAGPTAVAVDRSQGEAEGTLYVTSGSSSPARVLAFAPLAPPSRPPRPDLSFERKETGAVDVDAAGNRYLAVDSTAFVYDAAGQEVAISGPKGEDGLAVTGSIKALAVDSACNVYALDEGVGFGNEKLVYFSPGACPPQAGTKYSGPVTVASRTSLPGGTSLFAVAVNPANDHVFLTNQHEIMEIASAADGSAVLTTAFGGTLPLSGYAENVDVHGATGNVYVGSGSGPGFVWVIDPSGTRLLAKISGAGSPKGPFGSASGPIAVDQSSGHVLVFNSTRGVAEEYEPSGAFVAEYGSFDSEVFRSGGIAIDNSGGPNDRNVYVSFFHRLTAFGPLTYGEPPIAITGLASQVAGGKATLAGSVDARGFELEDCHFEHLSEPVYLANLDAAKAPFDGATQTPCTPSAAEIGFGSSSVSAQLNGLDPSLRYRFRLVAENKYDVAAGEAAVFGPPSATTKPANPVSYTEARLRAVVDPSGLPTTYRFQYGEGESYSHETAAFELDPDAGSTPVDVPVFGLPEGTIHHFRVVVENEVKAVSGEDEIFETLERAEGRPCPNDEFRTGRSASLPGCRAYELVTPAETQGLTPFASGLEVNSWRVAPSGSRAGRRLSYATSGTLPGYEGSGRHDGYLAERGEGAHPAEGWQSRLVSHSYVQAGGGIPEGQGISPDQRFSLWRVTPLEALPGTLDGSYLRTSEGFEPLGKGTLGEDLDASPHFLAADASHVIFASDERLEPQAPPKGTEAVYDRTPGGPTSVVSLLPGDVIPPGDSRFRGAAAAGDTVAFEHDGALYARLGGEETVKVADAPNTFAGLSADGSRLFYADTGNGASPGDLFAYDLASKTAAQIAEDAIFVNVSADGSRVYLTSREPLDDAGRGVENVDNLYVWDGEIRFVAVLDPQDVVSFEGLNQSLVRWTDVFGGAAGRGVSPTRTTPDGSFFVFQTHARLTSYDNAGFSEVYRYDALAEDLVCLSCDPRGNAPSADDTLQTLATAARVASTTLIPNITEDGGAVYFQSDDRLIPGDVNDVKDVYEWSAEGGDCERAGGCLALISSGQGESDNYLYSMTPDGHDVFFRTLERLHGTDIAGSPSIYDARVEGGIPDPPVPAPCLGDACRGEGSPPPAVPAPSTIVRDSGSRAKPPRRCSKGKRRARRAGRVVCIKRRQRKQAKSTRPTRRPAR